MKIKRLSTLLIIAMSFCAVSSYANITHASNGATEKTDINIGINQEDRDVGLKRMEIIDKILSQDMLNKKMDMVHAVEADYNEKAMSIINSIIPPIFNNRVFTHIDVNFFSPEFESQVNANQKVYLSFIVKKAGFERWAKSYASSQEALDSMKRLLGDALKIPLNNISGVVVD